jgi:peptidoglycan-associated lipoprotein
MRQAKWLKEHPAISMVIEGHCDERGTREYNIALGDKRANSAKSYLTSNGVDSARIKTISYGKERPAFFGTNEDVLAKNRRAVTVVN